MEKSSDGSVILSYNYTVNAIGQRERVDRMGSAFSDFNAPHASVPGDSIQWKYDALGQVAKANDFAHRFSTKPLDSETGFYYYGYRYYDSIDGKWLNRDPLGEFIFGVDSISSSPFNLIYGFISNNVIDKIDLLGLSSPKLPTLPGWSGASGLYCTVPDSKTDNDRIESCITEEGCPETKQVADLHICRKVSSSSNRPFFGLFGDRFGNGKWILISKNHIVKPCAKE